jgi:pimeloyl-ACP methyl ester carboxylesterase
MAQQCNESTGAADSACMRAPALLVILVSSLLTACAGRTPPPRQPLMPGQIMPTKTIVFVHGMFVTPSCWKKWQAYFEARGYRTLAPAWPEHDPPAATQRARHPNAALGKLELADVLERYRQVIRGLNEKPILVGHSMGGLVVQLLLQEDLGVAGIAIDSAPPKGVLTLKWSFLKSNWPVLSPFATKTKPVLLDEARFHYAFTNTLDPATAHAAYESESVPESRLVGRGPLTALAKIDFARPRPPLLLVAGAEDHIIPAVLNEKNFAHYRKGPSITELKVFPGRDHWLIASDGWEEIADYVRGWIEKGQRQASAVTVGAR